MASLQSRDFTAVLIGIGRPASRAPADVSAHVLAPFTPAEAQLLWAEVFPAVARSLEAALRAL